LLEELDQRRTKNLRSAPTEKIEARHGKGLLTARERLDKLFSPGTFLEMGAHAQQIGHDLGERKKDVPCDGVVTGTGLVDGRPIAAFSQDFLVLGGTLGRVHAQKICDVMTVAMKNGMPVVGLNDSGGARIQEGVQALSGYGQVFFQNVELSGVVPQIALIMGPCAGGAAYSPALCDFVIMTRHNAQMFICGPEVIRAVTGQSVTMDEIGSAEAHASVSGNIHFIAENDADAIGIAKRLLAYLPSNNLVDPPHRTGHAVTVTDDLEMRAIIPSSPKDPFDIHGVIHRLVDGGDFLESQREFARNIVTGFGRVDGVVIGIIANQPAHQAGVLDIDASDKAARFIRFCNCFNIPLVNLVDVPGFMPGVQQERGGIIRHGAKMLFAYAAATVPKITIILRKAYGGAYLAMCSKDMGADFVWAWPTAEIAVMGAEGAVRILYKKELAEAEDKQALEQKLIEEYRSKFASPYRAAGHSLVTDVIDPARTRTTLSLALRTLLGKRDVRPPKKHGNIPL
ncbi:MAG TPA: acyl-CoA carboxylase subunit beta, partial [Polyangiaceae bacterium]